MRERTEEEEKKFAFSLALFVLGAVVCGRKLIQEN
jgi:hypothetical protein